MDKRKSLNKLILIICDKETVKEIKKKYKSPKKRKKPHIIAHTAIDKNFSTLCQKIHEKIQWILEKPQRRLTLSTVSKLLEEGRIVEVDDKHSNQGETAAQKILENIDSLKNENPSRATAKILPFQCDLSALQEMAILDKIR